MSQEDPSAAPPPSPENNTSPIFPEIPEGTSQCVVEFPSCTPEKLISMKKAVTAWVIETGLLMFKRGDRRFELFGARGAFCGSIVKAPTQIIKKTGEAATQIISRGPLAPPLQVPVIHAPAVPEKKPEPPPETYRERGTRLTQELLKQFPTLSVTFS